MHSGFLLIWQHTHKCTCVCNIRIKYQNNNIIAYWQRVPVAPKVFLSSLSLSLCFLLCNKLAAHARQGKAWGWGYTFIDKQRNNNSNNNGRDQWLLLLHFVLRLLFFTHTRMSLHIAAHIDMLVQAAAAATTTATGINQPHCVAAVDN